MDCGDGDLVCIALGWLSNNEFTANTFLQWIADPKFGWLSEFLDRHGEKLIGIAGFSFGLYRWWVYRETILHKRLFEYLKQSDARLSEGRLHVLDALTRPSPGTDFKLPLFANAQLRRTLARKNWGSAILATTIESSADRLLTGAIASTERQLRIAEDCLTQLRSQLATAHIIRGALASSRAEATKVRDMHFAALRSFRNARQVPGHDKDVVAMELAAHQLRKLGMRSEASQAYFDLEQSNSGFSDYRAQRLAVARARRYRAELCQLAQSDLDSNGKRVFKGSGRAEGLLYPKRANSALALRENFAPYQGWDEIEQADTHFVTAFVAKNNGDNLIEGEQLLAAENAYKAVLADCLAKRRFWQPSSYQKLVARARLGTTRVDDARAGTYDTSWLSS